MKQSRTKLAQFVAGRTLKEGASKKLSEEIAAYLLAENRVAELDSVLRDVQADWAAAGFVEVLARSAHPLSAAVRKNIQDEVRRIYPEAKHIRVTEVHDPEVVGGVSLSLPGRQLDLSLEAKLNRFKQLTMQGKD